MRIHRYLAVPALLLAVHASAAAAQADAVLREDLRIGSLDGPAALDLFGTIAVDRAGRMWIAQPRDGRIRVFAADGSHVFDVGRQGEGPGEFGRIGKLYYREGAVHALDTRLRRVTTFDGAGDVVETRSLVAAAAASRGGDQYIFGDSVLTLRDRTTDDGTVTGRFLTVMAADGTGQRVLLELPSYTTATHQIDFGGGLILRGPRLPFSDFVAFAVAPDGSGIAVVDQDGAAAGDRTSATVRVIRADGRERRFEVPSARVPVAREQVAREIAPVLAELADLPDGLSRAEAERILRDAYGAEYHPPVSRLLLGLDGTVWIRRERVDPAVDLWQVLDDDGSLAARVRLPAGATVLAADRAHVWARVQDELDVPYLVRYRLVY
jgi:hypothetical protein